MERQPWIPPETVKEAKQMDLLTYLQRYEPGELVRVSPGVYSTREHDSLKISNGKWCWWSQGIGGRSALDFLIKVKGMCFQEAVQHLCDLTRYVPPPEYYSPKPPPKKAFILPPKNMDNDRVTAYLMGRGISLSLIRYCIGTGRLYEDTRHNCVFVGFDNMGTARHGFIRSSSPSSAFLRDVEGSDKRYSFSIQAKDSAQTVCVFESAIDLLSYITLEMEAGRGLQGADYLSLSGVYAPSRDNRALPPALSQYLLRHPHINNVALCLDNDRAGHMAARAIQERLPQGIAVETRFPASKDYNAQLMRDKGISGFETRGDTHRQPQQKKEGQER